MKIVVLLAVSTGVLAGGLSGAPALCAPGAELVASPSPDPGALSAEAAVRAEAADTVLETVTVAGFRVATPLGWTVNAGAIIARTPRRFTCATTCVYQGLSLDGSFGQGGAALSVGWGRVVGTIAPGHHLYSRVHLAYAVRGSLMRTAHGAPLQPSTLTLAGAEGSFTVIGVNFRLGVYHPVGSPSARESWVVAGGIGWGF